jgi:hypothetical protein
LFFQPIFVPFLRFERVVELADVLTGLAIGAKSGGDGGMKGVDETDDPF